MKKELVREEKMTDRLKQLAQQTIDVIGCEKLAPETRLRIIKAYILGLVDGITVTRGTELDTCTKCGKKTGQASYVLGHRPPGAPSAAMRGNSPASLHMKARYSRCVTGAGRPWKTLMCRKHSTRDSRWDSSGFRNHS